MSKILLAGTSEKSPWREELVAKVNRYKFEDIYDVDDLSGINFEDSTFMIIVITPDKDPKNIKYNSFTTTDCDKILDAYKEYNKPVILCTINEYCGQAFGFIESRVIKNYVNSIKSSHPYVSVVHSLQAIIRLLQ